MQVPLLGQPREDTAAKAAPDLIEADCAFLVYIPKEPGPAAVSFDIDIPITTEREAQPSDVIGALAQIDASLRGQVAAITTVNLMNQVGKAAMEAQMQQQVLAQMQAAEKKR